MYTCAPRDVQDAALIAFFQAVLIIFNVDEQYWTRIPEAVARVSSPFGHVPEDKIVEVRV